MDSGLGLIYAYEQRNAQGVHSSQQKKAFPSEWILSLGLIYEDECKKVKLETSYLIDRQNGVSMMDSPCTDYCMGEGAQRSAPRQRISSTVRRVGSEPK